MPKRIILVLFTLLITAGTVTTVSGQRRPRRLPPLSESQMKEMSHDANDLFKSENYKEALVRYERLVMSDSSNLEYNYRLGVCYVLTDIDPKKAVEYLRLTVDWEDAPKEMNYYLGEALRFNHEFSDAIDAFERYKTTVKKPDEDLQTDLHIQWCKNAMDVMAHPVDVRFENPGKAVNSPYPDFRPVTGASDDVLFFSSNRKGTMGGVVDGYGEYVTDAFYSQYNDTVWKRARNAGSYLNNPGYNEVLSLSMNSDKMLIYNEGYGARGDIYFSQLNSKQWIKPIDMGKTFETRELEEGATMMEDIRTIYFSADMKGGLGGKDIWMRVKDTAKDEWSDPINLGDHVNTPYDDINPFLFFDGKTLFFASRGHNSMGGFDLFKSEMPDPRQGWGEAQNLGYPVNTVNDDKYITVTGTGMTAYVSALRDEGLGETDIYKVTFKEPLVSPSVEVNIVPLAPSGLPDRHAICIVTVKSNGELVGTFNLNAVTGQISFAVPPGAYRIKIRARSGKVDQDIELTPDDAGHKKTIVYRLK